MIYNKHMKPHKVLTGVSIVNIEACSGVSWEFSGKDIRARILFSELTCSN